MSESHARPEALHIAVAGGTGQVGTHVTAVARARGHRVVSLSRGEGVDLTDGSGLGERLAGVDAVIDCLSIQTGSTRVATDFFTTTSRVLLEAGREAGVSHHLTLSIVGIDQIGFGYYRGKVAQEAVVKESDRPHTILRATQFHEFAEQMVERMGFGPVVVIPRMLVETVAAAEVAEALVDLAEERPRTDTVELAGPSSGWMPDLVRRLLRHRGRRTLVVPVPMPGAGRAAASGALTPAGVPWRRGRQEYDDWLRAR